MCCRSIPRCAAFSVGAEPRKIARASRRVTFRCAERRARRVDHGGRGRRAVDVGVDHRLEAVLQVLRDLRQHVVGVKRHPAGQDQRRRVVALPQLVDDRGHQPQHATGPLEPVQRRPVAVQPVEQLRVQRVRRLDPLLIRRLGDPRRELGPVLRVEVGEHPGDRADVRLRVGPRILEQPLPDDRERLHRRRGPPLVGDPVDHLLQPGEGLRPVEPADLDVGRAPLGLLGGRRGRRRRDGHHEQRAWHRLDDLRQRLRERELRVERPAGQVIAPVELPRVGDPLVDEDQARRVSGDQGPERVGRVGPGLVGGPDDLIRAARLGLPARGEPELPGQLAPERPYLGPVGLACRRARLEVVPDEHGPPRGRRGDAAENLAHLVRVLGKRRAGQQVVQREHRVRLAAAEVRLQVPHRRGVPVAADPPRRRREKFPKAFGQVRPAEELHRVHVLPRPLALGHPVQVGGELRAAHLPVPHVLMRRDHLPPRLEPVPLNPGDHLHGPPRLGAERRRLRVPPQLAHRVRLRRRVHRGQQPLHRVERPVRVIGAERLVVRQPVPGLPQLGGERLLRPRQRLAEHPPLLGDHLQQEPRILPRVLVRRPVLGVVPRLQHGDPVLPAGRLRRHRRVNERQQPRLQQLQPRVDPLPVTRRHRRHSRTPA